jgi:U3 small nucleolar RNA-associated protein 14
LSAIRKEKEEVTEKSQPQSVDLSLPGWGEWGGKNLPISSRKKPRFIIKFPEVAPRKDANKGSVIINEEKNDKVVSYQVSLSHFP